jgi:hypothetical protein
MAGKFMSIEQIEGKLPASYLTTPLFRRTWSPDTGECR